MKVKATSNSSLKVVVNLTAPKKKRAPRKRKTTRGNLPPFRGIATNFPARVIYETQPNAYANPPVQQYFMDPQHPKMFGAPHTSVKVEEVPLLGAQSPRPYFNERISFGSFEPSTRYVEKPKGTPIPFLEPENPDPFGNREPYYNLRQDPKQTQFFTPP